MMLDLWVELPTALALTFASILLLRQPAHRIGLVDQPRGRKRHDRTVPLTGGLAILLGTGVAAFLLGGYGLEGYSALIGGMLLLLGVGMLDDRQDLPPWSKFLAQGVAAWLLIGPGGLVVTDLGTLFGGEAPLALGPWAVPFTLVAVVGLINAINMFDGVDGLAGGTVAIAMAWLCTTGFLGAASSWVGMGLVLIAALLGFLWFNLRHPWRQRADCFLGDSGSMMLGLALAWLALEASHGAEAVLPPIAIAWVLALPVVDALLLMVRRLQHGRSPFSADREHLHHILYRAGFTPRQAVSLLLLLSVLSGGVGVLGSAAGLPQWLLALGLVPVVLLHAVAHLHAWRTATWLRRRLRALRRMLGHTRAGRLPDLGG